MIRENILIRIIVHGEKVDMQRFANIASHKKKVELQNILELANN